LDLFLGHHSFCVKLLYDQLVVLLLVNDLTLFRGLVIQIYIVNDYITSFIVKDLLKVSPQGPGPETCLAYVIRINLATQFIPTPEKNMVNV
jgi:hypothetical protein